MYLFKSIFRPKALRFSSTLFPLVKVIKLVELNVYATVALNRNSYCPWIDFIFLFSKEEINYKCVNKLRIWSLRKVRFYLADISKINFVQGLVQIPQY
jgi:hypothetical protein